MSLRFKDRSDAGHQLAARLRKHRDASPLVLGIPGGGVPVGFEIAREFDAPLDVWMALKLVDPAKPELEIGALAEGGELFIDAQMVRTLGATKAHLDELVAANTAVLEERSQLYHRRLPAVTGRTVILVDDGTATGAAARAALKAIRARNPKTLVFAVPVAATDVLTSLESEADEVVCVSPQPDRGAIDVWYDDLPQATDENAVRLLEREQSRYEASRTSAAAPEALRAARVGRVRRETEIGIPGGVLHGEFLLTPGAPGVVLFAQARRSDNENARNRFVAEALQRAGLSSLLVALLAFDEHKPEARRPELGFDIELLAYRLGLVAEWVKSLPGSRATRIGYFGAGASAPAALVAAANRPEDIFAVVSAGGLPNLADEALERVRAPTLLLVGSRDAEALRANREALRRMRGEAKLDVIEGATQLFEEPGALDEVAALAARWFQAHLASVHTAMHP